MIYPRFVARFLAWLGGYFWLPCPICKEPFAGFESSGIGVAIVKDDDGSEHMYGVCPRQACQEQGEKNRMEYMQRPSQWYAPPGYGIDAAKSPQSP